MALSVLCWSCSGAVEIYYSKAFKAQQNELYDQVGKALESEQKVAIDSWESINQIRSNRENQRNQLDGLRSVFSLFNSLFILMALPWFRYLPKRLESIIKSKYWNVIIGLPFLFSLFPTISKMLAEEPIPFVSELDVYYSTLTLGFLGYVLWESFAKRRLPALAWLSTICILVTFIAQVYKLSGSAIDLTLYSAIFKTSLIMIFFALALSWIKELAENVIPKSHQLFLDLHTDKTDQGQLNNTAQIRGIPGTGQGNVKLTPALHELLVSFARNKLDGEGWLEIKPKNDNRSKDYDIKDHNEIKRLLAALLDGIFGKESWGEHQHREPLKSSLFEMSDKRERKIRLAIPTDNISIS